ncbi:MAG: hypothetical protein OEM63_08795 [Gammaproteobacteria bacterium]|nr:hypothetical protein [Gammaproteobacteria bacterium]
MWSSVNILERAPMVWFLLGLLFNAGGLYLGFDSGMSLVYMMIGWFCCAYGVALFLFRLRESPKKSTKNRLSPNFVSLNSTDEPPLDPARNAVEEKPEPPDAQAASE